jgi:hypothetical protein
MSVIETVAAIGAALGVCFVTAIMILGLDATYALSVPVALGLTALAAIVFGHFAWSSKAVPGPWKLVTVPWAAVCAIFALPVLLVAPFAYLILVLTGSIPRKR